MPSISTSHAQQPVGQWGRWSRSTTSTCSTGLAARPAGRVRPSARTPAAVAAHLDTMARWTPVPQQLMNASGAGLFSPNRRLAVSTHTPLGVGVGEGSFGAQQMWVFRAGEKTCRGMGIPWANPRCFQLQGLLCLGRDSLHSQNCWPDQKTLFWG